MMDDEKAPETEPARPLQSTWRTQEERQAQEAQQSIDWLTRAAHRAAAMQDVFERVQRLARGEGAAWLCGELGSGRHTTAIALHTLSSRRAGPLLFAHGGEVLPRTRPPADPAIALEEAQQRLAQLDTAARGGTLILDEGGAPDLPFQGLVLDLLSMRPQARVILITTERPHETPVLQEDLFAHLAPRCVRIPPLRHRREEITPLAEALLAAVGPQPAPPASDEEATLLGDSAEGTGLSAPQQEVLGLPHDQDSSRTALSEDAAALLARHPFPGNLWQLRHALHRLAGPGRPSAGPLAAADLLPYLPSLEHPLGAGKGPASEAEQEARGPLKDPQALYDLGQALADLLQPLIPLVPLPSPDYRDARDSGDEHPPFSGDPLDPAEAPYAPLLLSGADDDPLPLFQLRLGPAPLDEARMVAGLQARPLGPGAGSRTGDAPALGRLGPTWRGHLLALLRGAQRELAEPRLSSPDLDLISLGQLLLLCGPKVSADKLVRLFLLLPVEFSEEETAALLERYQGRTLDKIDKLGKVDKTQAQTCDSPQQSRLWADALRGLLPRRDTQALLDHGQRCDRCARLLPALWQLLAVRRAAQEIGLARAAAKTSDDATGMTPLPRVNFTEERETEIRGSVAPRPDDKTETHIHIGHLPKTYPGHAQDPLVDDGPEEIVDDLADEAVAALPWGPHGARFARSERQADPPDPSADRLASRASQQDDPMTREVLLPEHQSQSFLHPSFSQQGRTAMLTPASVPAPPRAPHVQGPAAALPSSPLAFMRPVHWTILVGLLVLMLLCGTAIGMFLAHAKVQSQ